MLKHILLISSFVFLFCSELMSSSCSDLDHYKYGITAVEGNVRRIPSLNSNFKEVHDNLRKVVLQATHEAFTYITPERDILEADASEKDDMISNKRKKNSKKEKKEKEKVNIISAIQKKHQENINVPKKQKLSSIPNFSAVALTFIYKSNDGDQISTYNVYIRKKHVIAALNQFFLNQRKDLEEMSCILSGGRHLNDDDIFTFISGPLSSTNKILQIDVNKYHLQGGDGVNLLLPSLQDREKEIYKIFFKHTTGYEISYSHPRAIDSERYAFWILEHSKLIDLLIQEFSSKFSLSKNSIVGIVEQLHTFRDMCSYCLRQQNVEVFMSNKVKEAKKGFLVQLKNVLQSITPNISKFTSVISSDWRYEGEGSSSFKSKELTSGDITEFNVNQYFYEDDNIPYISFKNYTMDILKTLLTYDILIHVLNYIDRPEDDLLFFKL